MNNLPPSYDFKGDRIKARLLKSEALQFSNFVSSQADKEGINFIKRTKTLPDGSVIQVYSQKHSNYNNRSNRIKIFSPISLSEISGIGVYCTYFYSASASDVVMDGTIYDEQSKPPFGIDPISPTSTLLNSDVNTGLAKNSNVYTYYNINDDGGILYNRQTLINGGANTSGSIAIRTKVFSSDMTGAPLTASGASGVLDAYYSSTYSMVCSVNQSADRIHIYLDKIVGDTLTNKMDIYYEANPLTFTITTYHDDLGTITDNKVASLPVMTFVDNPRVIDAKFSPDGNYLSIILHQKVASSPNTKMVVLDFVIKLDSNGVWADPDPSPAITYNFSNNTSLVDNIPNESDYLTAISNNVSYNIFSFNYTEAINRVRVHSGNTLAADTIVDLTCYFTGYTWPGPFPASYAVANAAYLNPGTYESDFEASVLWPIVSTTYYYADSNSNCWTSVDLAWTGPSGVQSTTLTSNVISARATKNTGNTDYTYSVVSKGSAVGGVVYDLTKSDTYYPRYWINLNYEWQDKSGNKVTDPIGFTDNYSYASTLGATDIAVYDAVDLTTLRSYDNTYSVIRTYKRNARLVILVKVGGVTKSKVLSVFDISMEGVMDTDVITESKKTIDWVYDSTVGLLDSYNYIYSLNHYFINKRAVVNPLSFFYDPINNTTLLGVFKFNKSIDFTSFRNTKDTWNKEYEATISANANRFPNGIQITHTNAVVDNYSQILNSNVNATTTTLLGIVKTNITTAPAPASVSSVQGAYPAIPAAATTTTETVNITNLLASASTKGMYIKMNNNSYLAWCSTDVTGSGAITNYLLIDGVRITQLINTNAFNNFPANQQFGIGFSI